MEYKHAYLIIAHNEFEVLERLVNALDDKPNDIYIHIDAKVKKLPKLHVKESKLYIIDKRIDVRWGNISQIESEYILWETAYEHGPYEYYHLISGTHFPLASQNTIRDFFESIGHKNLLSPMATDNKEITFKILRYNICTYTLNSKNQFIKNCSQIIWRIGHWVQKRLPQHNRTKQTFYKASNWVSLTHETIEFFLSIKDNVLRKYKYSWCGDEFFVPSELNCSQLKDTIYYTNHLLKNDFISYSPRVYIDSDYIDLINSNCLFARKFTKDSITLIDKLEKNICLKALNDTK
ncbi:MAG: glycosyl transferase [Bacteroidaceae bacterium]|nr:glycosyl transferase [Bacteroidaceae bacterium]